MELGGGKSKLQPEKEETRLRRPPPCTGQTMSDWEQSTKAVLRSRELVWLSAYFVPEAKPVLMLAETSCGNKRQQPILQIRKPRGRWVKISPSHTS